MWSWQQQRRCHSFCTSISAIITGERQIKFIANGAQHASGVVADGRKRRICYLLPARQRRAFLRTPSCGQIAPPVNTQRIFITETLLRQKRSRAYIAIYCVRTDNTTTPAADSGASVLYRLVATIPHAGISDN